MPRHESCPPEEDLLAFHLGEIEGESLESLCAHLSSCTACERRLAVIEQHNEVLSNLRQFLGREPPFPQREFERLERKAQAIVHEPSEGPSDTAQHHATPAPVSQEQLALPARLGKYELLEELGRGGMGVVYSALHTNLNKRVAVKVLLPEYATHPRLLDRFRREARAIGGLAHPNIVTATDADEAEGRQFLVMELVEGLDLETLLRRGGSLPVAVACEVVRQAAVGLQYIHQKKGVHRDLKPSNLMITAEGVVKILDLGLAGLFENGSPTGNLTGIQQAMGTPDYMAPEQWIDSHQVDIRADIYSLGCTLFKLLTGHVPYGGPELRLSARKQLAHTEAPIPSARLLRPEVPMELDAVVQRMMAKRPEDRPSSPQEVVGALTPFAADLGERALTVVLEQTGSGRNEGADALASASSEQRRAPSTATARPRWRVGFLLRSPARRWALLAVLLVVSVAAGWVVLGWKPDSRSEQPSQPEKPPQPGEWYPLLRKPPIPLFWHNGSRNHFLDFMPEARELRIDAPYVGLIELGKTEYPGYRIQLEIRQTHWTGGVGFFFGYHEETIDGHPCLKFQVLELKELNSGPNAAFLLQRSWLTIRDDGLGPHLSGGRGLTSAKVKRPTDGDEVFLQIEVKPQGLTYVAWGGKPLPELVAKEANVSLRPPDYVGSFGTFNRHSTSVYGNALLKIYERPAP